MKKITFLAAAASAALVCSCAGQGNGNESGMTVQNMYDRVCVTDESTIAHTVYGDIQGYKDGDIFTFKGIQYAKAERFMPPVAPDKHEGVLKCRNYGPKAPQTQTFAWDGNPQTDYAFGNQFIREPMDEKECLVLNVWTKGLKEFPACGRFEIRARLHSARGAWPAFWLLPFDGATYPWPSGGEIDIMERLNGEDIAYQTVHSPYTLKVNPGAKHGSTAHIDPDAFNIYGVDINPDSICFHINHQYTYTYQLL